MQTLETLRRLAQQLSEANAKLGETIARILNERDEAPKKDNPKKDRD